MTEEKKSIKVEEEKTEKVAEAKVEEKKEEVKEKKTSKKKKSFAFARGKDLGISQKHSMAICRMIKGKRIQDAIKELELVLKMKKAVPMKGEIPHRKGPGMMSGRYPQNASKEFINLLKGLDANARVLEINDPIISLAKADQASRPNRRFGSRRFKRTHVLIYATEFKQTKK